MVAFALPKARVQVMLAGVLATTEFLATVLRVVASRRQSSCRKTTSYRQSIFTSQTTEPRDALRARLGSEAVTCKVEVHVSCSSCRVKRLASCCGNKTTFAIRPSSVSGSNVHVSILVRKRNFSRLCSREFERRQMSVLPTIGLLEGKIST